MNEMRALPYRNLTDFEIEHEHESHRQIILDRLENNGFAKHLKDNSRYFEAHYSALSNKQYYDIDEYNNISKRRRNDLKVAHVNIRRIAKNRAQLMAFLLILDTSIDILMISEVGDDAKNYINKTYFPDYEHQFIHPPDNNKYGGTAILIKKDLGEVREQPHLKIGKICDCVNCYAESTWVELCRPNGNKFVLGCIYRHNKGNRNHFTRDLNFTLEKIDRKSSSIIGGDINISLINYEETNTMNYYTSFLSHNFLPYIITPTRITDHSATLIDHIFVRLTSQVIDCETISGNILTDITDHLVNFFHIDDNKKQTPKIERPKIRVFSEKNIEDFKTKLQTTDWASLLNKNDVDELYNDFYTYVFKQYDSSFPLKTLSRKRAQDKKWVTPILKDRIKHKNILYWKQLKNPSPHARHAYIMYRNELSTCLKESEKLYYEEILSDRRNSVKNFWKQFGSTLNHKKSKQKHHINKLLVNNKEITSNEEITNTMTTYFCKLGKNISDSIDTVPGHFSDYLRNKVCQSFFLSPVANENVLSELNKLNEKKSSGPDNFTPKLVHQCADIFVIPLTIIYNKCIEYAKFPSPLKLAKVIALYKKKSHSLPSNYRPISLLNCFSKIFEKLIYKQMIKFIEKHKILYINQFGFRKGYSTTMALIEVVEEIKIAIDKGEYAIGIFLDIQKAFDSIDHNILLKKLDHYGFRGHSQIFLKSYLSNRSQYTEVNGSKSKIQEIKYGVPQGSVLGPLLFLLFVNDFGNAVNNKGRLFADDTSLLIHHKNIYILVNQAQGMLCKSKTWFALNKMSLNYDIGKSHFILFHGTRKDSQPQITHLIAGNVILPRQDVTKYVGLNIDEKLTWEHHIKEVCKSLVKYFGIFYNIRNFIDTKLARIIYYACIYSKIKYGIEIYGTACKTKLETLQVMQNKLMKVLTNKDYMYSTNALHKDLKIMKIEDIYKHTTCQFVYNCINKNLPDKFHNYFIYRGTLHGHNTKSVNN